MKVEPAVSVLDRAGARALGLPLDLPGEELGASGSFGISAVDVFAEQNLAAEGVGWIPLEIHLLGRHAVLCGVQLDQGSPEAPRVGAVNVALVGHRRGDIGGSLAG